MDIDPLKTIVYFKERARGGGYRGKNQDEGRLNLAPYKELLKEVKGHLQERLQLGIMGVDGFRLF